MNRRYLSFAERMLDAIVENHPAGSHHPPTASPDRVWRQASLAKPEPTKTNRNQAITSLAKHLNPPTKKPVKHVYIQQADHQPLPENKRQM
jgi:hypothetical protein